MIQIQEFCVYRLPRGATPSVTAPPAFPFVRLDVPTIQKLFPTEARLKLPFLRFAAAGASGWAIVDGDRWVGYGWRTNCAKYMPEHLGRNIARPVDWIYFCGTHPDYQRRGLFKAMLQHLISDQRESSDRDLFVDNSPSNTASRRAVERVGFVPAGMFRCFALRIPRRRAWVYSRWNHEQAHPPLA